MRTGPFFQFSKNIVHAFKVILGDIMVFIYFLKSRLIIYIYIFLLSNLHYAFM